MSREFYIDFLERLKVLNGRFKNLKCINYDKNTGKKQGNFSLVFKGHDNLEDTPVAIKLFDPDASHDPYRLESFRREPEILKLILGKNKCFQLVDSLKDFKTTIKVPIPTGGHLPLDIHFQYFVTEWIDHQIDQYFESQQDYSALKKLYLFNDIVIAVEALHRNGVSHRDLKADNFRSKDLNSKGNIVAIDIGTAIHYNTKPMLQKYSNHVGFGAYSAPETRCGLSGERSISKLTDIYALGCLLFELFNYEKFFIVQSSKSEFLKAISAMAIDLGAYDKVEEKMAAWRKNITKFNHLTRAPSIEEGKPSVPKGITKEIDQIIKDLVCFDFYERKNNFDLLRNRIWRIINIVQNEKLMQERIRKRQLFRQNRLERLKNSELKKIENNNSISITKKGIR